MYKLGFTCKICYEPYVDENTIFLMDVCDDVFHAECLKIYLEFQINNFGVALNMNLQDQKPRKLTSGIKCPSHQCQQEISDISITNSIRGDKLLHQKYIKIKKRREVESSPDLHWCLKPNCEGTIKWKLSDEHYSHFQICTKCQTKQCMICKVEYHEGQTCKEYQESQVKNKDDEVFLI